jgi:hypothetical protein
VHQASHESVPAPRAHSADKVDYEKVGRLYAKSADAVHSADKVDYEKVGRIYAKDESSFQ